jgi:RNA polymerase sigma-70 factor (ECF subfamily)
MSWADLLQEAMLRMLQGSRRRPEDVSMVAFLAGVMRSIREERFRRARREAPVPAGDDLAATRPDPAPDPERCLAARQELQQVYLLFTDDPGATAVLDGLGAGLSPDEICAANRWSRIDYDSVRKRMRRTLLRHNLAWRQP